MIKVGQILDEAGVYKITCQPTGKMYVGSSISCRRRLKEHLYCLRKNRHNKRFQNAFIKYGENDFTFEVLEYCNSQNCRQREQHWLDELRSYDRFVGLNMSKDASYGRYEITDETRKKISNSVKLTLSSLDFSAKTRMTEGSRQAGLSNLGKFRDQKFKDYRRKIMLELSPMRKTVFRNDGMTFKSVNAAAAFHNVSRVSIRNWCNGKPIKNIQLRQFTFCYTKVEV